MLLEAYCDNDRYNNDETIYRAGDLGSVALRYFMTSPFYRRGLDTHVNHLFNEDTMQSTVYDYVSVTRNLPELKRMLKEGVPFRNLVVYRAEEASMAGVLILGYILPDERSRPSSDPCEAYIFWQQNLTIYRLCDLAAFRDMFAHNLCYSMCQAFKGWQRQLRAEEAEGRW